MIGKITTRDGRVATLEDNGEWSSTYDAMSVFLNTIHSPLKQLRASSKAHPWWGRDEVIAAARFYDTHAEWPTESNAPEYDEVMKRDDGGE